MKGSDLSSKKIISIVLSVSLTMHVGLSLYNSDTNAADRMTYGVITVSGSDVTLDFTGPGTDSVNFTIDEGDSGGYKITCDYPAAEDDAEKEVSSITKLSINASGDCQINADMESELVLYNEYTSVTIGAGYVFDCTGLTAAPAGGINVYGTFIMDDFNSADYVGESSRVAFFNYGVIAADNVDITDTTYLRNNESSVYRFSNSFVKGEEDFPGKVVATEPDATVTSGGGSFLLEYEGISAMIEGDVDTTVADLLLTATSSYFDFPADNSMNAFYYGVDYDFEPYIVVTPDDYPGTPYVEYAEDDMEMEDEPVFSTTKPEDPGMYIIRIQVPTDGEFAGSTSLYHYFNISFLYIEAALFPDTEDQYVQFDNVVYGSFVNDVLKISAAPGFEISCPNYDGGAFESQIELSSSDVFDGDEINGDTMLAFRRQSSSETTDYFSISEICPEIADITFDEDEPVINLDFVDGQEASLDDGGKVNADQVEFSVWDDTLKEIYINGTLAYDQDDFEEGYQELTFTSTEGEGTEYVIRAVDIFDQESTFGFTLYPPQVDPELEVTLPDEIFVEQDFDVTINTNSDGQVSIKYYSADSDTPLEDKPTTAGSYICAVYVEATDLYNGAGTNVEFEIKRYTGTATITVPQPLYVGDEYNIDIDTESDGEPAITYRYNDEEGQPVSAAQPTAAGNYTVLVSIPQTSTYDEINTSEDFSIIKRDATATISVPDSHVGETYTPTTSTTSNGAASAVIEYKVQGADDRTYTTTQPTAAGDYTARYTVPATDEYLGTFATDDFTISKNTVDVTVSVPDTVYGESYTPTLTTESDGAERAVYEYKVNGAADSTFTTTAPTLPGDYIVRVTVPETDAYNEVSATDTFTIGKGTVDATVSVPDTVYGESYTPTLTTDSDGAERAVYEYKVSGAADSTYTTTAPTAPGDYVVRVTVPETDIYNEVTATDDFTISKGTVTATVSVPDTVYGETYTPTLTTVSDGADRAVYEYKVNGTSDSTFTTTAPTVPGEYIVRVTVPETDIYNEVSAADSFTISKGTVAATVSVPDTSYGETYSPTLNTESDGADRAVYEYKVDGAADSTYTTTAPTVPGDYIVRVTVPETDLYNEVSATDSFTISKATATATITVPDSYVGDTYTPVTSTNSDGAARGLIEYKIKGAEDWTYTTAQPFVLGTFTARYTVPETDNYYGVVVTDDFTISRRTATASVSVPDTVYGESYSPTLTTDSDGADRAVYEYKVSGAADNTFTTTAPTMPGDYIVRVTVPETDTYNAVSATDSFTISKKTPTLTFTVSNSYVGTTYSPSVTTDSNMASSAVIEYKEKAAPDTDYTTTKPTAYGEYIARVIVPASDIYFATSAETEFKISYLESPENAFNFEGTEGNNGYYTSEVELKAPEGYQISSSYNGTYSDSIQYNENIRNIYLKRNSDGALTAAIALSNRPKIDMAAPEITSTSGSIENGSIHYAQNFEFSATDPNLKSLKINGEEVDLSTLVGNKITLTAGYGFKSFTIIAEDEAGNISKVQFILMAEWLKTRLIPADLKLPLIVSEAYILDDGEWTVNDDATVYVGGGEVYVRQNADYTFTRSN